MLRVKNWCGKMSHTDIKLNIKFHGYFKKMQIDAEVKGNKGIEIVQLFVEKENP